MKIVENEKINNLNLISTVSKEKSKKSSVTLSCSNLSEMMANNLERETYKFLKPKVIIESDGSIRIEKPNYSEIAQKIQDENFKKNFPYIVYNNEKIKITSASFRKPSHSDKWSEKETELFYQALEIFGCNFSYLEIILNPRTREQIKKKFSREEKSNKEKIEYALKNNNKGNLMKFAQIFKNYKENVKKNSKVSKIKGKYSKLIAESEVTLSNYDNVELCDDENEKEKIKKNNHISKKGDNKTLKNIDNEFSQILKERNNEEDNDFSVDKLNLILTELEQTSEVSCESDEDSIERTKEKFKNIKMNNDKIKQNEISKKENSKISNIILEKKEKETNDLTNIKKNEIINEDNKDLDIKGLTICDKSIKLNKNQQNNIPILEEKKINNFDFLSNFKN